jgi:hypothetical protein
MAAFHSSKASEGYPQKTDGGKSAKSLRGLGSGAMGLALPSPSAGGAGIQRIGRRRLPGGKPDFNGIWRVLNGELRSGSAYGPSSCGIARGSVRSGTGRAGACAWRSGSCSRVWELWKVARFLTCRKRLLRRRKSGQLAGLDPEIKCYACLAFRARRTCLIPFRSSRAIPHFSSLTNTPARCATSI